jgi:hypothetical protein
VSYFEAATLDPFVSEFGKYWSKMKLTLQRRYVRNDDFQRESDQLLGSLLSGRYVREGQKDFLEVHDGRKLPPQLWSSGQQEVLPLAEILALYAGRRFTPHPRRFLCVEEPEAHLFPASQRAIIALIALAFNACKQRLEFFLTTHSPYVLSTANLLLKAGQLYAEPRKKAPEISNIVSLHQALGPRTVGAYFMDQARCRSILDAETGLIDGSAIDDISGQLAEDFDALSDLR